MLLHLRPICNFVRKMRQHGSPADKAALTDFDLSPALTEFVSKVLHPKPDESVWHKARLSVIVRNVFHLTNFLVVL